MTNAEIEIHIRDEHIKALDAKIKELESDNQALVAQINAVNDKLEKVYSYLVNCSDCPDAIIAGKCKQTDRTYCLECWKRYFEGETK